MNATALEHKHTSAVLVEGMARDGAEVELVDDGSVGHFVSWD